jgi:hypothetical protein
MRGNNVERRLLKDLSRVRYTAVARCLWLGKCLPSMTMGLPMGTDTPLNHGG